MIFSRRRASTARHARDTGRGRHERGPDDGLDDLDEGEPEPGLPEFGPYDSSAVPDDGVERLDLGSLRIPALKDVEIRLQASPEGQIRQVMLVHGKDLLELSAYAAPRSEGIWDETMADLRASLASGGGRLEEVEGDYGPELKARVRDGNGVNDLRVVGVEGPRWLVQGIYRGAAAADPERAGPLRDALRGLVVYRGTDAMPVREALPLRLPPEAAAQMGELTPPDPGARASEGERRRNRRVR